MQNILLICGKTVTELSSAREVLDWAVLEMKKAMEAKATAAPAPSKGDKALETILAPEPKVEKPAPAPKEESKGVNSFDLPPMRKPFFGGKDKGEMLSFSYTINGETPRTRPADTARVLFCKTEAYAQMPPKEKDKVVNWGLSFLKKTVRESGKAASCETRMIEAYAIDRFAFLKGAQITFRVAIKD
jgi:hypothetical protein